MIIIPPRQTKMLKQSGRSKILGDIWASFNLDLQSNLGVIKVSPRLQTNTSNVSNQGLSVAFRTHEGLVFTLAGTRIFKNSDTTLISAFTEDASTGAVTSYDVTTGDLETFFNSSGVTQLIATADTKLMSKDISGGAGAWTQRATLTTGAPHKLCYFPKTQRMYYFDNFHQIKSVDSSWSEATSGSNFFDALGYKFGQMYTMCSDSSLIWIGTAKLDTIGQTDFDEGASIVTWDGATASGITSEYKIKARAVLALCKDDRQVMHAIDSNGAILQFTGSGFEEIDRLPLNRELLVNSLTGVYNSFIHPNGFFFSRNGTFLLNINNGIGDNTTTFKENFPSGIWEFHKDTGFIHRQSYTYNPVGSATVTDFGQNRVFRVGALSEMNIYSTSASGKPTLIAGAGVYVNSLTQNYGIFVDEPLDSIQKYGYFVTQWILSSSLKENWQKIALKYRKFLDSNDKIVVKYRTTETAPTSATITWATTTTFTTSTDLTGKVGYEIEVTQGTGGGKCSHISSVTGTGPYTVTVDEIYTGVTTGTAVIRVQNWIKTLTINDQMTESVIKTVGASSERIQFKVCMLFTGEDELYETIIINSPHTALE